MARLRGKHLLMELLLAEGVDTVFGNPGTTESPFMDALQDYPQFRYVLTLQESVAIAAADGYARASGKVGFANVHIAPGVGNALSMLYDASKGGTSLVVTAGQSDTRMLHAEPHLSGDLVQMTRQYTKYSAEVLHVSQLASMVRRAFKMAAEPPKGPTFLSLPWNVCDEEVDAALSPAAPTYPRIRPDEAAIQRAAEILAAAHAPIMLVGDRIADSDAAQEAAAVAETIGARVYAISYAAVNFPSGHPQFLGSPNLNSLAARDVLASADVVLAVGCNLFPQYVYLDEPLLDPSTRLIHLDSHPGEIGKVFATEVGIHADPKVGLSELGQAIEMLQKPAARDAAARRRDEAARVKARQAEAFQRELRTNWEKAPIHPSRMAHELAQCMPPDAVVVDEAITSSGALQAALTFDRPGSYLRIRGGAIGWGMGAALGVQLANPGRPVVAVIGDGSAMYSIQGLWTAAHERLPVKYVICGNHAYRILKLNLLNYLGESSRPSAFVGMDLRDPILDFAAIARAFGLHAERVEQPDDLRPALERAISRPGPALVDVQLDGSYKDIF
jgi:benzoylformate decarboxylase